MNSPEKEINIHASCVAIGKAGVLLLGRSGAGKSDLALRLIDDGARLVSDDRVLLSARRGRLWARAPQTIHGLLEIRGLGIVALGARAGARIALAVELGRDDTRLPPLRHYTAPLALTRAVPLIRLDPRRAAAPAKLRAALAAFSKGLFAGNHVTK